MRRKSILGANKLQLETKRIIIRDSAFNFNTGSFTQRLSSVVKTWSAERLIEVPPKVKDDGGVVNARLSCRSWIGRSQPLKRSLNPREELTTMWSRLYRNHVIMAFPTYNTVANAWAPQADINWFAGSSHDSKFVRFSKRCTTEEEAVTWVLRRSEVWVDNRLRRLNRAILPERGRAIDMIEAAKSLLGKVTPKQPVRARSSGRRMLQRRIGTQP